MALQCVWRQRSHVIHHVKDALSVKKTSIKISSNLQSENRQQCHTGVAHTHKHTHTHTHTQENTSLCLHAHITPTPTLSYLLQGHHTEHAYHSHTRTHARVSFITHSTHTSVTHAPTLSCLLPEETSHTARTPVTHAPTLSCVLHQHHTQHAYLSHTRTHTIVFSAGRLGGWSLSRHAVLYALVALPLACFCLFMLRVLYLATRDPAGHVMRVGRQCDKTVPLSPGEVALQGRHALLRLHAYLSHTPTPTHRSHAHLSRTHLNHTHTSVTHTPHSHTSLTHTSHRPQLHALTRTTQSHTHLSHTHTHT